MTTESYKRFRPTKLDEVVGQDKAVKTLRSALAQKRVPHTILFTGPSGCGKTTLARIMAKELGCGKFDLCELNAAEARGIDSVRDIQSRMSLAPMGGKCRVFVMDEIHALTKDAQNAFLKTLEDTPRHVYFFLCTTDKQKLLPTIMTRCTEVAVSPIPEPELASLVQRTWVRLEKEPNLTANVLSKLCEVCEGSARKALVLLDQIVAFDSDDERIDFLQKQDAKRQAIEICRVLMNPNGKWLDLLPILNSVEEEPETIRHMVLGYCNSVMLKGGKLTPRAYMIIQSFSFNFYDSKKAGLTAACYEVLQKK